MMWGTGSCNKCGDGAAAASAVFVFGVFEGEGNVVAAAGIDYSAATAELA